MLLFFRGCFASRESVSSPERASFFFPPLAKWGQTHNALFFFPSSFPSFTFSISLWEPGPLKPPVEDQTTHQQQCLTRKCLQRSKRAATLGDKRRRRCDQRAAAAAAAAVERSLILLSAPPRAVHAALGRPRQLAIRVIRCLAHRYSSKSGDEKPWGERGVDERVPLSLLSIGDARPIEQGQGGSKSVSPCRRRALLSRFA